MSMKKVEINCFVDQDILTDFKIADGWNIWRQPDRPSNFKATLIIEIPEQKIELTMSDLAKAWDEFVFSQGDLVRNLRSSESSEFRLFCKTLGFKGEE